MQLGLRRFHLGLGVSTTVAAMLLLGALVLCASDARAADESICAKQDARLAATGKGDRDHDGLSNCREKRITGTSPSNADSDGDGVMDGTEISDGTNPMDDDTDHDGLDDGQEMVAGSNPNDPDSDHDGVDDGEDSDPSGVLEPKIVGPLDSVTCPAEGVEGSLSVLGIQIALTPDTLFDHSASCADLAAAMGVEVRVTGTLGSFVAASVSVEDGDDDGMPDDVEEHD